MSVPIRPLIPRVLARAARFWLPVLALLAAPVAMLADVTGNPGEKKKKPTKDTEIIVEANAASATFVAGQSVAIELVASVPSLRPVTFIIRDAPKHGTLSAMKPHPRDNNKVIVTYTHRDVNELSDHFTYACRFGEGPVSAAATVTLTGQRMEPKLSVLSAPRMGRVYLGGQSSARLKVKNIGLADYDSAIVWPAPWTGPPRLSLKVGEEQEILLGFKPSTIGAFRLELALQPGVESSKVLAYGECSRSLTISPGSLVLAYDKKSSSRQGVLTFANARPEAIKVAVTLPDRLKGSTDLTLTAGARQDVVFSLRPEDVKDYRGELQIAAEDEVYRIAVAAAPTPGDLTIMSPKATEGLELGTFDLNTEGTGKVILKNTGGLSLTLDARTEPPFFLNTQGRSFRIEPGQMREVIVSVRGDRYGRVSGTLLINDGDETFNVALGATIREAEAPAMTQPTAPSTAPKAASSSTPAARPQTSGAAGSSGQGMNFAPLLAAYLARNGMPIPPSQINPYLEKVEGVYLTEQTSTSVTLEWKKPKVPPVGWRLEVGSYVLDPDSGLIIKAWTPFNNWKLVDAGTDKVSIRIHSLKPSSQFDMRIMAVDRDGKFSTPSSNCVIRTAAPWRMPTWVWQLLSAAGLALAIYVFRRYRRGGFDF